jgi:hypothetical protein
MQKYGDLAGVFDDAVVKEMLDKIGEVLGLLVL